MLDYGLSAVEKTGERWCEAEVNRIAGEISLKSPEPDAAKAETYFERALAIAHQQQAKSWELRVAMSISAHRTRVHSPLRRGFTSVSNHSSNTWCRKTFERQGEITPPCGEP